MASAEVRPEHLVQFAFMGAALAQVVLGVEHPRVGLLSNGEEAVKGTPLVVEAHAQLAARAAAAPAALRFVGNLEGTDLTTGAADVVVTDGFTGNVVLKTMEGVSQVLLGAVRGAATSGPRAKAGGALLRPALRGLRDELDPEGPGGAYLLGLRRLGVVPHGRFTRYGFSQAILLAARGVSGDVVGRTHAALDAAGALRRAGGAGREAASGPPSSVTSV
jgi:glycerol-3-phosphate acyltransferase PlsX